MTLSKLSGSHWHKHLVTLAITFVTVVGVVVTVVVAIGVVDVKDFVAEKAFVAPRSARTPVNEITSSAQHNHSAPGTSRHESCCCALECSCGARQQPARNTISPYLLA
jgi:hypothetical protein